MREIFLATDIEADGPVAPDYSMLAFASDAFIFENGQRKSLGNFTRNLKLLRGARQHKVQMSWWKKFPEAWKAIRENPQAPTNAMREYRDWLKDLNGNIVLTARPVAYDHAWMRYYFVHFLHEEPPFAHRGLDLQSYMMGMLRLERYSDAGRHLDKFRDPSLPHPHIPLPDAIEEGTCFHNVYIENMRRARAEHALVTTA
jgi:hypothetical protein